MKTNKITILFVCLFLATTSIFGTVKLPTVFADDMMFQRNKPIKIWGEADKGEQVQINFMGETLKLKANKQGKWEASLKPRSEGGPYTLIVKGAKNSIEIKNILIGDIWFCSGQSNMEMTINGWAQVYDYEQEIANANYPQIRTFNVEKAINTVPQSDLDGRWLVCSPSTASDFSATAYFFARKLYQELNVPIGIVHSSWGGTQIEPWISGDTFSKLPDKFMSKYKNLGITDFETFEKTNTQNQKTYTEALNNDLGLKENWQTKTSVKNWGKMQVPQAWSENELSDVDGIVWFKHTFVLPKSAEGKSAEISLGCVDDNDMTWINGQMIGQTKGYNVERKYDIPSGLLKEGENTITVRVYDESGGGGICSNADELYIKIEGQKYSIAGNWSYMPSVTNTQHNYVSLSSNSYPSLLYNAMVNPLLNIPLKGTIWYQGESNADNFEDAYNYRTLFPALINDWRAKWNNPKLPFYWVQLANYKAKDKTPQESEWAVLRESQDMTLSLNNTGQAVIADIGDANDIHPKNKQDVGLRLALIVLNRDYNKNIKCEGPRYSKHEIVGDKIIISLNNVEDGLIVNNKYGYIEGFSIAGADQKFVWAQAYLENDKLIIKSDNIKSPVAVRYGWANNPDISIFSSAGLPLAPFRTDDWYLSSKKQ